MSKDLFICINRESGEVGYELDLTGKTRTERIELVNEAKVDYPVEVYKYEGNPFT